MTLDEFRGFIDELTALSGNIIRRHFGDASLGIEWKADETPVTQADRDAEQAMRRLINSRYPRHGIIGEEFGSENANAEHVWVLDPIDGTKTFAAGCPLFGTLIALLHGGKPVLGAIHHPALDQLIVGDGSTTILNGKTVRRRPTTRIEEAILLTTSWTSPTQHQNGPAFAALVAQAKMARTWGDCYGYSLVATGWADIMCDPIMNPWDVAALIPVVRGAGGTITNWQGNDPVNAASMVAAATPELHAAVIEALNP